jgi:hypothetical protein
VTGDLAPLDALPDGQLVAEVLEAQGLPHRKVAAMVGLYATTVRRIMQEA